MGTPNQDERRDKAKKAPGNADQDDLEQAEGEVQQKAGDQKRQAGEAVEDQRERIRRNDRR